MEYMPTPRPYSSQYHSPYEALHPKSLYFTKSQNNILSNDAEWQENENQKENILEEGVTIAEKYDEDLKYTAEPLDSSIGSSNFIEVEKRIISDDLQSKKQE